MANNELKLLRAACQRILTDAESFDIHIGNKRANLLRRALGLPEVIYDKQYQSLLNSKVPLLP